jgi:N-acetylneuraminate synthase
LANRIDKTDNARFSTLKDIFEKSLAVNKNLPAGHILTFNDLEAKKPKGFGISANAFEPVLGKKLKAPMQEWDFLQPEQLAKDDTEN